MTGATDRDKPKATTYGVYFRPGPRCRCARVGEGPSEAAAWQTAFELMSTPGGASGDWCVARTDDPPK